MDTLTSANAGHKGSACVFITRSSSRAMQLTVASLLAVSPVRISADAGAFVAGAVVVAEVVAAPVESCLEVDTSTLRHRDSSG